MSYNTELQNNNQELRGILEDVNELPEYPQVPTKISELENDSGFIKQSELDTAINTALAAAKESGEFDGADGKNGCSFWYTTARPTMNPDGRYEVILASVISTRDLEPSDLIVSSNGDVWHYDGQADATAGYASYLFSIKGADGVDGKTPVKGTDYFTAADKAEMVNAVINSLTNASGVSF